MYEQNYYLVVWRWLSDYNRKCREKGV